MRLRSYKMTGDKGFAPTPFGCSLTLATCKPAFATRPKWRLGRGLTSKSLAGHYVGSERLVYLMHVAERLLGRDKSPDMGADGRQRTSSSANPNHAPRDRKRDVGGTFVLVSNEFYYFGGSAPAVPRDVRPDVPRGQSRYGQGSCPAQAERFLRYIRDNYRAGRHGQPHNWLSVCGATRSRCA